MKTVAEENYLKALYHLSYQEGEVSVSDLSNFLGIKMPTVTSMMKKMASKGLVVYESYKPLRLSREGELAAAVIIRKHRLTEMFLVEKMGFGWEQVHEIAEQVEHIQSVDFFDKMDELLGYPKFDPHGSPIPNKAGEVPSMAFQRLSDSVLGNRVKLMAVTKSSDEFLAFLNSREIYLGLEMEVVAREPFDRSMIVNYGTKDNVMLSKAVCERLLVELI